MEYFGSALAHVDHFRLYAGTGESELYSRMIDGRTIFQYLQFIEPVLRLANPELQSSPPGTGHRNQYCPYFFTLAKQCMDQRHALVRSMHRIPIEAKTDEEVERVRSAAAAIDACGLGFFLDIGLASIAFKEKSGIFQAPLKSEKNANSNDAIVLLRASAENFLELWGRVEIGHARCINADEHRSPQVLRDLFADCVVTEFYRRRSELSIAFEFERRMREKYFADQSIESVLDGFVGLNLSRELVAYWMPLWNRAAVIFASPFDTMPSLGSL